MRTLLMACVVVALIVQSGMTAHTAELAATDLKIQAILDSLEKQMERIRLAREKADTQMSLARIRIAERLRLSEEDLARQVETLSRIRDQLLEATGDAQDALAQLRMDWPRLLETAFAEIDRQLRDTNSLLTQMETIRENFEDRPVEDPSTTCPTCPKATNVPVSVAPQESVPESPGVTPAVSLFPQPGGCPFAKGLGSGQ